MTLNKKKIGIFGGTFNPVHYGHLLIAENACDQFELDHVIFLPTGHTPHKAFMGEKMSIHRCHMVEAAIADNPKFSISYREIESTGVNYTYVTLARFHNDYANFISSLVRIPCSILTVGGIRRKSANMPIYWLQSAEISMQMKLTGRLYI